MTSRIGRCGLALAGLLVAMPAAAEDARTVTVRLQSDYDTLDPAKMRDSNGYQMALSLYDRLTALGADGAPVPSLAESWETDGTSVIFTIRDGVTCSDGHALTATDVANSLTRMGAPETNSPYAYRTTGTTGYSVTGDDAAGTVTFTTAEPFSDVLIGLSMPWASIVCPAGLEEGHDLAANPVGSGPFVLDAANSVRADHYTLTAREDYAWGPEGAATSDPGMPSGIVYRVIANQTTAANELLGGGLDVSIISGQDLQRLASDPNLSMQKVTPFGMQFMFFNHGEKHVTSDPLVRRAIAAAFDREAFTAAATFGNGVTAQSYVSDGVQCFDPAVAGMLPTFDVEAARQSLAEAGFDVSSGVTKDGEPVEIRIVGVPTYQNSGPEYLQAMLQQIGFQTSLRSIGIEEFSTVLSGDDWDVSPVAFGPPMPSPNTITPFVTGNAGQGGSNFSGIVNAEFEAAREAALAADPAGTERCEHWSTAQQALVKDLDILPLFGDISSYFSQPGITFGNFGPYVIDPISIKIEG